MGSNSRYRAFVLRPGQQVILRFIDFADPLTDEVINGAIPQVVISGENDEISDLYLVDRECVEVGEKFDILDSGGVLRVQDPHGRHIKAYSPSGWRTMTSLSIDVQL